MVDRDDPTAASRIDAVRHQIYEVVLAPGGTITGEHGIGLAKKHLLETQVGPGAIRVMRAIKQALDPQGLLNPGKVFDPGSGQTPCDTDTT